MEIMKTIGRVLLGILKILSIFSLWILRAAFELAKLFLMLLALVLKIVFAVIRNSSEF